jgi:hypothetical protein
MPRYTVEEADGPDRATTGPSNSSSGDRMSLSTATFFAGTSLLAAILLGSAPTMSSAQDSKAASSNGAEIKAVLELYTSQGCSSCPPADALLESYVARNDVVALSFSVDYWDYLGWKDTLANAKFSARQRYYAKALGSVGVYTPQMVVNGRTHVVGSSAAAIDEAIAATKADLAASRVPVSLRMDKRHVVIELGEAPAGSKMREATVWLALIHRQVEVQIPRGENRGRAVKYFNVVRELSPIGMWSGKAASIQLPREVVSEPGNEACAVLVQVGKAGPIIGAAQVGGL